LGLKRIRINAKGAMRTIEARKGSVLMSFHKAATAVVAAVSMIALPSMAAAQSASKLSVASARTGADIEGEKLAGGSLIIAVLAAAAVVAGIIVAADSDDEPESA
jgi:hypothetical protein